MNSKKYYFGKFRDPQKEKTMSFRVSEETKKLFETHADTIYGGTSNALKEIFLEYMSRYAFRRQTLQKYIKIWIPKCEREEDFENHLYLPFNEFGFDGTYYPEDLNDLDNVIVDSNSIGDYSSWDLENVLYEDDYLSDRGWIEKHSSYDVDDLFFINVPINNQLDIYMDGIYCLNDDKDNLTTHGGISIVEFEGVVYYVCYTFQINSNNQQYPFHFYPPTLVDNREAFSHAMDCGNLDLAMLIDSFNDGTSNIDHDKQLLMDKRENLLHQLDEIDEKLSKF